MSNERNKTEADFAYERYTASNNNEIIEDDSDPVLEGDSHLRADIGLNNLEQTPEPTTSVLLSPAPDRDELLESNAIVTASAAGLTGNVIDYAEEEEQLKDEDEVLPLEDIPDADEIDPGSTIDPASPPVDIMPGTDVINGSKGE